MKPHRARVLAAPSLYLGLAVVAVVAVAVLAAAPARAASLTMVPRATWGASGVPSYVQMYIYVPDRLASKPPILVSTHACGSTATGQIGNIAKIRAAADANGFILVLPDNPGQNCWDVGATASLKHDGGGDTQAVAQMVKYALTKYSGDVARVYAHGGSSGGMMTQALMAVYPDLFRAGAARAGVPAGCWADGYDPGQQWSNNCAGGKTSKSAQQWGDQVRAMFPGYTGHRPRLQIMQGQSDATISYNNTAESIKEWTNVLGLGMAPTSMDTGYKAANATYNRQFWKNACGTTVFEAWSSPGGTHSMPYEEADILKFFGLDVAGGADPEPDCPGGGGGVGGSGGASGTGGMTGAGGARDGGADVGTDVGISGGGGVQGGGGRPGTGGSTATGGGGGAGPLGSGGESGGGNTGGGGLGVTGSGGSAGSSATGGTSISGSGGGGTATGGSGLPATGGGSGSSGGKAGGSVRPGETEPGGCSCLIASGQPDRPPSGGMLLLIAVAGLAGRRRRGRVHDRS